MKDLRNLKDTDIVQGVSFKEVYDERTQTEKTIWERWEDTFGNIKENIEKITQIEKINGANIIVEDFFFYDYVSY